MKQIRPMWFEGDDNEAAELAVILRRTADQIVDVNPPGFLFLRNLEGQLKPAKKDMEVLT